MAFELQFIDKSKTKAAALDAPLSSPYSWTMSSEWGIGVGQDKPRTKAQFIEQYTSWVYVFAKLNAQAVASVPLHLYVKKTAKSQKFKAIETRPIERKQLTWLKSNNSLQYHLRKAVEVEEVTEHRFLDLMQNVNPFMNARDLWETTCLFADLTGEAYWYLLKDNLKVPKELWVIPSQYMEPVLGETTENFIKGYRFQRGKSDLTLPVEDVIQFVYPNPKNQATGFSCIKGITDVVYLNTKMFEYEEAIFKNKARSGGILETTESVSRAEMERLRMDWQQKYEGVVQSGKTIVLPPGMKFTKDTMTPQELAFIEGKKITREEIAAGFDAPIALFDAHAIRANVEGALYFHAKNGVMPRCIRFQEKMNEQLLPIFDENLFVAFDNIVPEDQDYGLKEREVYINQGILSPDEVREDIGKEALPDGIGSIPYQDGRRLPLGATLAQPSEPVNLTGMAEELQSKVWDALHRKLSSAE